MGTTLNTSSANRSFRHMPDSRDITKIIRRFKEVVGSRFELHTDLKDGFAIEVRDTRAGQTPHLAESFKGQALAAMSKRADLFGFTLLRREGTLAFADSVTGYPFRLDVPGLQLEQTMPAYELSGTIGREIVKGVFELHPDSLRRVQ